MMLEWAAEQTTEITTTAVEDEFGDGAFEEDSRVLDPDAVCQQMHTPLMALTNFETKDIVDNSDFARRQIIGP